MTLLLIALALGVAYANGANDVSKSISTLVGSGLASYRRAVLWGAMWTAAGAALAGLMTSGLIRTFSTALLVHEPDLERFSLAVAAGACGWVLLASRTGLPVSTTHALTGAIVGAAVAGAGPGGVRWPLLAAVVALPLAASPLMAAATAYGLYRLAARPLARAARYCVCVESRPAGWVPVYAVADAAVPSAATTAVVEVGREERCEAWAVTARVGLTDAAHWASSAVLSFARGLNDNPKIMALAIAAGAGANGGGLILLGAGAMALGGVLFGRRVTTTLGERVTAIDPLEGFTASVVASGLVLAASFAAVPVSTTHVATGAIVGAGLHGGGRGIHWDVVGRIGAAWVITLPAAALFAALTVTVL